MVSHTTTGEWQSFELRMRRRRAERLLLRAEAALDAGCLEDARQCVAEARTLEPDLPRLADLEGKLSGPPPVQRHDTQRRVAAAAAVLTLAGTVALGGWVILGRTAESAEPVSATSPAPSNPAALKDPVSSAPPLPSPADVFASETAAAPGRETVTPQPQAPEPVRQEASAAAEPAGTRLPAVQVDPPPPRAADAERAVIPPPPALEPALEPAPVAALLAPTSPIAAPISASMPLASTTSPPPAALPTSTIAASPAAPAPAPSQEPAVRSVLDRYAAAYSALDVDAAQRVWPAVNRGALARAFDSLASQDVSLGNCRIDVAGASAAATCTGSASWSPKVGDGGQHHEARTWTFELARGAGGWQIVSARVQNR